MKNADAQAKPRPGVVLYLDLDGVVHHEAVYWHARRGIYMHPTEALGRTLFEWLPQLQDALAPYPDVSLVLSSSWCIRPGYGKTLKRLPESLRNRFIGGTFHKRLHGADAMTTADFRRTSRGQQILADVTRRQPRQWLALDDDTDDWPSDILDHLVPCDGAKGLSDPETFDRLCRLLERCHRHQTETPT